MSISCLWIKYYYTVFRRRLKKEVKQGFQVQSFHTSSVTLQSEFEPSLIGSAWNQSHLQGKEWWRERRMRVGADRVGNVRSRFNPSYGFKSQFSVSVEQLISLVLWILSPAFSERWNDEINRRTVKLECFAYIGCHGEFWGRCWILLQEQNLKQLKVRDCT